MQPGVSQRGWLLDTNVLSELRKGNRSDRNVRAWGQSITPVACFVSRVTLAEIRFEIERVTDPAFQAELEAWLSNDVRVWFGTRVLEVDEAVLLIWRHLADQGKRSNYTYSPPDALLAATALVHGLGVVTRNTNDFVRAGLRLLNPWDAVTPAGPQSGTRGSPPAR